MTPAGVQALVRGAAEHNLRRGQHHADGRSYKRHRGAAPRSAVAAGHHVHPLLEGVTTRHLICDVCGVPIALGMPAASCRACDYDECESCSVANKEPRVEAFSAAAPSCGAAPLPLPVSSEAGARIDPTGMAAEPVQDPEVSYPHV